MPLCSTRMTTIDGEARAPLGLMSITTATRMPSEKVFTNVGQLVDHRFIMLGAAEISRNYREKSLPGSSALDRVTIDRGRMAPCTSRPMLANLGEPLQANH
jgi:hypothetical protein